MPGYGGKQSIRHEPGPLTIKVTHPLAIITLPAGALSFFSEPAILFFLLPNLTISRTGYKQTLPINPLSV